ncbi:MAG: flagellar protein FlaG [Treponema sp.]|nr:flagellar protein FlaG [Treponema sp.]
MSMQVTAVGNGYSPVELTQERVSVPAKSEQRPLEMAREPVPQPKREPLPEIMADLEKITVAFNKKLKFEVNHQSNDVTIKVIDPETDKVIKELPPKELQRLHSRIKETIGFLFDEII